MFLRDFVHRPSHTLRRARAGTHHEIVRLQISVTTPPEQARCRRTTPTALPDSRGVSRNRSHPASWVNPPEDSRRQTGRVSSRVRVQPRRSSSSTFGPSRHSAAFVRVSCGMRSAAPQEDLARRRLLGVALPWVVPRVPALAGSAGVRLMVGAGWGRVGVFRLGVPGLGVLGGWFSCPVSNKPRR
jgi:hypothetical protein